MGKAKRPSRLASAAVPKKATRVSLGKDGDRSKSAKRELKRQKFNEKLASVAPEMMSLANKGRGRVLVSSTGAKKKKKGKGMSVLELGESLSSALDESAGIGAAGGRASAPKNAAVLNRHNIRRSKAKKNVLNTELLQFSAVVAHPAFKSGGLSTIKEHLMNTVAASRK